MERLNTPLCKVLNIEVPIIQAPIGSATCPNLVAAVSNSGGLGIFAASWRSTDELKDSIQKTKKLTDRPFGVNLVLNWPRSERLEICLREGVPVISFSWGDPTAHIDKIHDSGAIVMHTVGNA